jgi:hypothetical protein
VVEVPADDLSKEELQLEVESHDDGEEVMDAGDEHAPEPEPEGEDHADETTPDE